MSARRKAAVAVAGLAPLTLTGLSAAPAAAHGSMGDPVSRVAQCYAEGPESPGSAACGAAVSAGGTQALYDWNGIRIGDAGGRHQDLIPDGKLCSAGNEAFKGLDLARTDWPTTSVSSGSYTFKYRVTAPHKGTFKVYITKPGYDPSQPLAWGDLDLANPVASATDPAASGGFYTFTGTLPERSGKQVLYAVWQRSDSPEAFYSCSDVTFGGGSQAGGGESGGDGTGGGEEGGGESSGSGGSSDEAADPAPTASAPSDEQIEDGAGKSTVENHGHGDDDHRTSAEPVAADDGPGADDGTGNRPKAAGAGENLAETGGAAGTPYLMIGGAAALALGSAALFASARRRTATGRHGR
ncbi:MULTISPECIES: lytic polysaccharide monooxygenase [unclassified Streptomyces]|uniref:lytic polysaccharide monooxygenase auxiliary activity family 9 protein n=1 Tax=unclassified Streptomyces TaxID=2593676 RepID=UPI000F6FC7CD|nr:MULTISPECIES: lytic polysaccharide monooxygenase [unclassified Streptomyces]AZM63122.1 chitin-binding protein [Streptomyces sp. WAC 01438]RSN00572.1 chitin-binding protein [Streptomyces sp. WAC 01420]